MRSLEVAQLKMVMTVESAAQQQSGKLPRPGSFTSLVRKMFEGVCHLEKKSPVETVGSERHVSVGHDAQRAACETRDSELVAEIGRKCPYSAVRECPVPYVFQMPVHYPRYTKQDYEAMPEWMLDRLLEEYGLPVMGNIEDKRDYCIGSFLWHDE
ncbi:hypothetical protein O6H91_03G031700 [Diphasiastrum complanatum]|uniref:Uncharacterized protein n=1 Tax=Diphasiastrum complanatum TaxID=34168 RepID=A0ACC2E509_DIPCM|nr:hypothetical protein O6H91_Y060200 [Diphasiastrum complanatum]KAJ7561529.1 hypothetical protein O6H91_03G031700 [Diphasiastrum complanatum]